MTTSRPAIALLRRGTVPSHQTQRPGASSVAGNVRPETESKAVAAVDEVTTSVAVSRPPGIGSSQAELSALLRAWRKRLRPEDVPGFVRYSDDFLDRVAVALRLSEGEREVLYRLAIALAAVAAFSGVFVLARRPCSAPLRSGDAATPHRYCHLASRHVRQRWTRR